MTRGEALNKFCRQLIITNIEQDLVSDDELFGLIKSINNISRGTFDFHNTRMIASTSKERQTYLDGPKASSGRKRTMDEVDDHILEDIVKEHRYARVRVLHDHFLKVTESEEWPVSHSTIERALTRCDITPKNVDRQNILSDPVKQVSFLNFMRPFPAECLISVDETSGQKKKFYPQKVCAMISTFVHIRS
jgi:hypothetical protein